MPKPIPEPQIKNGWCSEGHLGGFLVDGDKRTWTPELWQYLLDAYSITSVIDLGCAVGFACRWFRSRGCEVLGIDGSRWAADHTVIPGCHVVHDFCNGPFETARRFDLLWSCEFLEHVEERFVANILETIEKNSHEGSILACTAAPPGQNGYHHVNCQPKSYWIERMVLAGFWYDPEATITARAMVDESKFFARSGMIFRRQLSA